MGAVDYATTDLLAAVSGADLVVLCTPLAQMRAVTEQFLPALKKGAIVTDVGSVKAGVVRDLEALVQKAGAHFVGGHPMAGGEKMGVKASRADLYHGAICIITLTKRSHAGSLRKLEQFWRALGSRTVRMDAAEHDRLVSRSGARGVGSPAAPGAGDSVRHRLSRYVAAGGGFARNVARYFNVQPQKSRPRNGSVYCGTDPFSSHAEGR